MNLKNLPDEAGTPLAEFKMVNERFRLTLRPYMGTPIFRLERWMEPGPEGLWIFCASEGLSLSRIQAESLAEGLRRGLGLITEGSGPFCNPHG